MFSLVHFAPGWPQTKQENKLKTRRHDTEDRYLTEESGGREILG